MHKQTTENDVSDVEANNKVNLPEKLIGNSVFTFDVAADPPDNEVPETPHRVAFHLDTKIHHESYKSPAIIMNEAITPKRGNSSQYSERKILSSFTSSDDSKEDLSVKTDSESTTYTASTFGTLYTLNTAGTALTLGIDPLLKGDDIEYLNQRYGFLSLMFTIVQLFTLTMTISLCGFAPFAVNYGFGPYADSLSKMGALNPYLFSTMEQYWRFLTAPFMTSSILHFLINSFFQLEAGAFLEREWGSIKWCIIYFSSAFGAATFSSALSPNVVSVTSSSALFGIMGAKFSEFLMIMNFRTKQHRMRREYYMQQMKVLTCISIVLLSTCLCTYVEFSGILGGFLFGFSVGMLLLYTQLMKKRDKILWISSGVLIMTLLVLSVYFMLLSANSVPELSDVCYFYDSLHYEGYDCQCI